MMSMIVVYSDSELDNDVIDADDKHGNNEFSEYEVETINIGYFKFRYLWNEVIIR